MPYKISFSMAAMLVLVLSCKGPAKAPIQETDKEPPAPAEAVAKPTTDTESPKPAGQASQSLDAYADAALSIGYLLKADALSWPEIEAKYKIIEPQIKLTDEAHKTSYGEEIPQALARIQAGDSIEVNLHVVTKSLQHISVLTIGRLLDELITGDLGNVKKISGEIAKLFSIIEPTFKRRDETVYAGKPTLVPAAKSTLAKLEAAESKTALAGVAMELTTLLSQTYVLSVLFEMKGVEEFCGTKTPDPDKCTIKRTEAGIYYRIIKEAVASRDKEADSEMEKMINSAHSVPSYAAARDLLAKTLPFTKEDLTFGKKTAPPDVALH